MNFYFHFSYNHMVVNHSQNFVEPHTKVHKKLIECSWRWGKKKIGNRNNTSNDFIRENLITQHLWRRKYGRTQKVAFIFYFFVILFIRILNYQERMNYQLKFLYDKKDTQKFT